jgi:hypothetical protein
MSVGGTSICQIGKPDQEDAAMKLKRHRLGWWCTVLLLTLTSPAAQPRVALDQVALARQLVGLWRLEVDGNTAFFLDMKPFGDGALAVSVWYTGPDGDRDRESQCLYGYNKKSDKWVGMSVNKASGEFRLSMLWFTADHRFEGFTYKDPSDADGSITRKFVVEFREPDEWFQTNTYPDGRPNDTENFRRVRRY